jgi:hypothetical protein
VGGVDVAPSAAAYPRAIDGDRVIIRGRLDLTADGAASLDLAGAQILRSSE